MYAFTKENNFFCIFRNSEANAHLWEMFLHMIVWVHSLRSVFVLSHIVDALTSITMHVVHFYTILLQETFDK